MLLRHLQQHAGDACYPHADFHSIATSYLSSRIDRHRSSNRVDVSDAIGDYDGYCAVLTVPAIAAADATPRATGGGGSDGSGQAMVTGTQTIKVSWAAASARWSSGLTGFGWVSGQTQREVELCEESPRFADIHLDQCSRGCEFHALTEPAGRPPCSDDNRLRASLVLGWHQC